MIALLASAILAATLAATTSPGALVIPAGQARERTEGGAAPGGWNLWSNGRVGDFVRVAAKGTYQVVIVARGTPAGGVWPRMDLVLDGVAAESVTVDAKEMSEYRFKVELTAGLHRIAAAFTNDAVVGAEDRNLYLARIEIRPPAGVAAPTLAPEEDAAVEARQAEESALAKAAETIKEIRQGPVTLRVVDADGKPVPGAAVAVEETGSDFLFGANIYMFDHFKTPAENDAYKQRFRELFNYATVGFYWRWYEAERGKPGYAYTDKVVSWCAENGLRMKGHPLLWGDNSGIPPWSTGQPAPDVQKARVTEIIQRYRGKIGSWEVVNEPSHCRGVKIDDPYRWAREADPKATLIVNDYSVMADGQPGFYALLDEAKRNGVPFDGIGIQAHEPRTMRFPLDQVKRVLDRYATLGKTLHITEFTPCSGGQEITGSHVRGKWDEAAQADYAVKFYTVCFAHPATAAITWWDLCDQGAWLPGGGLLRKDLTPKPAYDALRRLIRETWRTRLSGTTDADGRLSLRGFYGAYDVEIKSGGRMLKTQFHHSAGPAGVQTFTLPAETK